MAARSVRVSVVVKRTSYQKFVLENHDAKIARLLKRHDPSVARMTLAHAEHEATVKEVDDALEELGAEVLFRGPSKTRVPKRTELLITVGGDGTLLDASHLIGKGCPLLGINSAPGYSVGFFCATTKGQVRAALQRALAGTLPATELTRMRVELNGKLLHDRVLNEALFCQSSPAVTSRYILRVREGEEDQRSSGVWVGPAAGSTAAQRSAGGKILPLKSRQLQYVVREPYRLAGRAYTYSRGLVEDGDELVLRSKMREGKIFLDGSRIVHDLTVGDVLTMRASNDPLTVLGLASKRRR